MGPRFSCWLIVVVVSACATTRVVGRPSPTGGIDSPKPTRYVGALVSKPVSFAILKDYDVGDDLTEVARDFAMFHELGVDTWRGSISWLEVEPQRARYDFSWLERFLELARDSGIALRPYVDYTPAWAAQPGGDADTWHDAPRRLGDWAAFVDTLARILVRYPNVRSLEIYNEENAHQWWNAPPDAYDSVLATATARVRRVAPRLQVILGGMVWPDAKWAAHACAAAHVDVVPFHAYPETWTPDSVTLETYLQDFGYPQFLPVERTICRGVPVWINETGFATVPGRSERDQAEWWARAVATFLAVPAVEHIGVYEIKDLRADAPAIGGVANYHLGLAYADRHKKLAFSTVHLLVHLLGSDSLTILDPQLEAGVDSGVSAGVELHAFRRLDGRQVVIAWTRLHTASIRVHLPDRPHRVRSYTLDGTPRAPPPLDGSVLELHLAPHDVAILELL